MKTKIIYISGGEIFNVSDVRNAFEEVRQTLGLTDDTIFFGVPVDSDDAGICKTETIISEPIIEEISEPIPEPVKKTKISSKKIKEEIQPEMEIEPVAEEEPEFIPILSVLSHNSEPQIQEIHEVPNEQVSEINEEIEISNIDDMLVDVDVDVDITSEPEIVTEKKYVETYIETYTESENTAVISEMIITENIEFDNAINDSAPEITAEETLEQLLEKMAPLREDQHPEMLKPETTELNNNATLEKLASEFAEKQDDIIVSNKNENSGKIGKLKNILPFKKAKRDDSGLMGDLFGWAGVAANDDEFSMPGFFSTASSKK